MFKKDGTFKQAFAEARKHGRKEFTWKGKKYSSAREDGKKLPDSPLTKVKKKVKKIAKKVVDPLNLVDKAKKYYKKGKKFVKKQVDDHKQLMKDVKQYKKDNDGMSPGPGNDKFWKGRKKKETGGFRNPSFLEDPIEQL